MSYQFDIKALDDYVRVEVHGIREPGDSVDHSLALWRQVMDTCKAHRINQVLAVFNLAGRRTVTDSIRIINGSKPLVWPEMMIALVDTVAERQLNNAIIDQVMQDLGIRFQSFTNEAQALNWLERFK